MDPSQGWREHGEPERGRGSTTTKYLEILSLQRRSDLWVFRRGTWVQDETQPGALGSFSPPLQNKPTPIPSCSQIVPGRHGSVGHHSTDLPSTETIPSSAGQTLTAYPRFSFLVWIIIFLTGARLPEEKHIFGPHTKGFG